MLRLEMPDGIRLSKTKFVFLVVVRQSKEDFVYITESISDVDSYRGTLRMVSPLIGIEPVGKFPKLTKTGAVHFFFTPSPDAKLALVTQLQELTGIAIFFSHGNAEVLALHNGDKLNAQVEQVCDRVGAVQEVWNIKSNRIELPFYIPKVNNGKRTVLPQFAELERKAPAGCGYIEREIRCLMLRRFDGARQSIRWANPPAQQYIDQLVASLEGAMDDHAKLSEMWKFAGAHTYNTDQRFSGLPPILATGCPMGGFEVLGVGKALRAIEGLGHFVFSRIRESRLWDRLALFASQRVDGSYELKFTKLLDADACHYYVEQIQKLRSDGGMNRPKAELPTPTQAMGAEITGSAQEDMMTLVSYFSAREGFQFDSVGISIPLQVISSANTFQWSLMSLTHEYCHVISGAILAIVKRAWSSKRNTLRNLCEDVRNEQRESSEGGPHIYAKTPLDFMSKALLHKRVHEKAIDDVLIGEISHSLFKREDEVMTLIFDLTYFFRGDVQTHLEMYWSYWLGLPGIHADRGQIVDYIIRSCCSLAANYLDDPNRALTNSLKPRDLLNALKGILADSDAFPKAAIERVVEHIDDVRNQKRFENEIRGYLPLIVSTLAFLVFKDTRQELWTGRDDNARRRLGSWRKNLRIDYDVLHSQFNPLELISLNLPKMKPDEHTTAWLLTLLDMMCHAD